MSDELTRTQCLVLALRCAQAKTRPPGQPVSKSRLLQQCRTVKNGIDEATIDDDLSNALGEGAIRVANKLWSVAIVAALLLGCGSRYETKGTDDGNGTLAGSSASAGSAGSAGAQPKPTAAASGQYASGGTSAASGEYSAGLAGFAGSRGVVPCAGAAGEVVVAPIDSSGFAGAAGSSAGSDNSAGRSSAGRASEATGGSASLTRGGTAAGGSTASGQGGQVAVWPACLPSGCGACPTFDLEASDPACDVFVRCFLSNGCGPLATCATSASGVCSAAAAKGLVCQCQG